MVLQEKKSCLNRKNLIVKSADDGYLESFLKWVAERRPNPLVHLRDVSLNASDAQVSDLKHLLNTYGVVCILGAVEREVALKAGVEIERFCKLVRESIYETTGCVGELRNAVWQQKHKLAKSMQEFCSFRSPIINIRGSKEIDGGMFDMFNIDKIDGLDSEQLATCYHALQSSLIKNVVAQASSFRFSTFQVYRNYSVTNTRGFHVDNLFHTIKSFLYLTDVEDETYGPYSYIPGSHQLPYLHRMELRKTERQGAKARDIWSSKYMHSIDFCAPAGSLILSDQTGIHRGLPQMEERLRVVAVGNYNRHRLDSE